MSPFYVTDPDARDLLGHPDRRVSAEAVRLKAAFGRGLDAHGAQVVVDELKGRNFDLVPVVAGADYGHRRLQPKGQVTVLAEIMRGVDQKQVQTVVAGLQQSGHEIMIRDRSRGLDPMAAF